MNNAIEQSGLPSNKANITIDEDTIKNALAKIQDIPETKRLNALQNWEGYRITTNSNYPTPKPIFSICNESLATAGNIVAISGLQKSGKSSLSNIILSGAIRDDIWDGVPPELNVEKSLGKAIIHIDTEQAKHKHLNNLKHGILKRINRTNAPEYFYSYNIRGIDISEAIQMLNEVCEGTNNLHNGIHFILIDGIADFIKDVNDAEASNEIVKHLESIATKYNTLIIVVIHRNPNDSKIRGHLGSNLLRKCESVIAVKKENDCSYIDPEELRNASTNDIPRLLFQYDKDKGYHRYIGIAKAENKTNPVQALTNYVDAIFSKTDKFQRKDLIDAISKLTNTSPENAQKKIMKMHDLGIIEQVSGERGMWQKVSPNIVM